MDWWIKVLQIASYAISIIGCIGAVWFALTRWVKKEYRLSRNLTAPVYLVADQKQDIDPIGDLLKAEGGMLSEKQVHVITGKQLGEIPPKKAVIVVVYYTKPAGERNPLLQAVMEKVSPFSIPLLVYSPDTHAVTEQDRNAINDKQGAISNYPLRLLSDIWATMCVVPLNRPH